MAVISEPWTCKQGGTFRKVLRFKSGGVPIDIFGWAFRMDIRIDAEHDVAASATIAARSPSTDGIADLVIPYSATGNLEPRTYQFDMRVDRSGEKIYEIEGQFIIEPAMTRG